MRRSTEARLLHSVGTSFEAAPRFRASCLNVKSKRSAWCRKAELNGNVDSDYNHGGSSTDICITSDWMFTRRRSVTASRMRAAKFTRKEKLEQHAVNWTLG